MALTALRAKAPHPSQKTVPIPTRLTARLVALRRLMAPLMALEKPIPTRVLPTVPTVPTNLGVLGKATPCATTAGEERREEERGW